MILLSIFLGIGYIVFKTKQRGPFCTYDALCIFIVVSVLISLPFALLFFVVFMKSSYDILMLIVGCTCIIILTILLYLMPANAKYSGKLKEKIDGFKYFLENPEEQEIKNIIKNDSNYFYEILPYAYAFGLSDIWINKFKNIEIAFPIEYEYYSNKKQEQIGIENIQKFMNTTLPNIFESMTIEI